MSVPEYNIKPHYTMGRDGWILTHAGAIIFFEKIKIKAIQKSRIYVKENGGGTLTIMKLNSQKHIQFKYPVWPFLLRKHQLNKF